MHYYVAFFFFFFGIAGQLAPLSLHTLSPCEARSGLDHRRDDYLIAISTSILILRHPSDSATLFLSGPLGGLRGRNHHHSMRKGRRSAASHIFTTRAWGVSCAYQGFFPFAGSFFSGIRGLLMMAPPFWCSRESKS